MFPRLPARTTFVADTNFVSGTQKMFLILFRNILCPQQMFPSLRSPRNIMVNNVSATMCPRLPGPLGFLTRQKISENTVALHVRCNSWYISSPSFAYNSVKWPNSRLFGESVGPLGTEELLKTEVSLWKRSKCFSSTAPRRQRDEFEKATINVYFDFVVEENSGVSLSFSKSNFFQIPLA